MPTHAMSTPAASEEPRFDPTFREKSAWACLLSTLVVFGVFFAWILWLPAVAPPAPFFAAAVVIHAAANGIIHIALSARDLSGARARADERDRTIDLYAHRVSSWILSIGVLLMVLGLYAMDLTTREGGAPTLGMVGNILLGCFVLAETAFYTTQVVLYRRSA